MATSLLSSLFGRNTFKIKNESTGAIQWINLKIINVDILLEASSMDHPMFTKDAVDANGYIKLLEIDITNGKIITPSKMKIKAIAPDLTTVESIIAGFIDLVTTYEISTKSVISSSMFMSDLLITQSSDNLTSTELVMEWEQATQPNPSSFDPLNSANDSTYGVRIQSNDISIPSTISSFVDGAESGAKALYDKVSSLL